MGWRFVLIFLVFAPLHTCFDPFRVFSRIQEGFESVIQNSHFQDLMAKTIVELLSSAFSYFRNCFFKREAKPLDVFPRVSVLPDPFHDYNIQREKSVNRLQDMLRKFKNKDGKVNIIYIIGSQGTGKTELARQYGNFEFDGNLTRTVVHLNMTSETVFKESLIKVITEIDLRQTDTSSSALIDYRKNLRHATVTDLMESLRFTLKKRPNWLLIVDDIKERNVTESEMYKMLPQPGSRTWGTGRMIVTTRLKLVRYDSEHVQSYSTQQGLDVEEAKKLLYLVTGGSPGTSSSSCVEHIARELHKSPGKIINVGFSMRNRKILDEINPSCDDSGEVPCYPYTVSNIIFGVTCQVPVPWLVKHWPYNKCAALVND